MCAIRLPGRKVHAQGGKKGLRVHDKRHDKPRHVLGRKPARALEIKDRTRHANALVRWAKKAFKKAQWARNRNEIGKKEFWITKLSVDSLLSEKLPKQPVMQEGKEVKLEGRKRHLLLEAERKGMLEKLEMKHGASAVQNLIRVQKQLLLQSIPKRQHP